MKTIYRISSLALLLLAAPLVQAQEEDGGYNERVIVVGSYKPVIEETTKVNVAPAITDTATTLQHKFTYNIRSRRLTSLFNPQVVPPARLNLPNPKLYNNYVRLGFGNHISPMADIYYNSTRSKKLNYGFRASHVSSWGKLGNQKDTNKFSPNYFGKNHWAQTDVSIFGKYIFDNNLQVSSDLGYNNDYNLYYGFSDSVLHNVASQLFSVGTPDTINYRDSDSLNTKDYRILYNYISWNGGVKNLQTDVNKLGYAVDLNVADLWATYGQNEFTTNLVGNVHYGFSLAKKNKGIAYLRFAWEHYRNQFLPGQDTSATTTPAPYVMPLGYNQPATFEVDSVSHRNLIKVNPYVEFLLRDFKFHAGLTAVVNQYDNLEATTGTFFPDVEVSKSFLNEACNISLGAKGGLHANSWNRIRLINPYILPGSDVKATKHNDFYAHLRFNFSKKLELNVQAEYSLLRNDLNFRLFPDAVLQNMFVTDYVNYNKATFGGEFTFINDEMMQLSIGGNYYHYTSLDPNVGPTGDTVGNLPLLYRPDFDVHAGLAINKDDKFILRVQTLVLGQMNGNLDTVTDENGKNIYQVSDTLPLRLGINAEIEYRYNKHLSFFLKADNLAFQHYYLWSHYPAQLGTFIVGVTFTVPNKK